MRQGQCFPAHFESELYGTYESLQRHISENQAKCVHKVPKSVRIVQASVWQLFLKNNSKLLAVLVTSVLFEKLHLARHYFVQRASFYDEFVFYFVLRAAAGQSEPSLCEVFKIGLRCKPISARREEK